jgi:hypothetical protein
MNRNSAMFDTARWVLSRDKKFVDSVNMVMKVVTYAIPLVVTALKLRQLNINSSQIYNALESAPVASWLLGLSLVIFYSSWIAGAYFDIGMQKEVYVIPPDRKLTLRDVGAMLAVAATFALLGSFLDKPVIFSAVLVVYWLVNLLAWRYLVSAIIAGIRSDSAKRYSQDSRYLDLAKLATVREYIEGAWQWWRFAFGGALVAGLAGFSLFGARAMARQSPPSLPFLPVDAIWFLLLVLVVESWMWYKRFATLLRLACFDDLGREYVLTPKPKVGDPSPKRGGRGFRVRSQSRG